MLNPDVDALVRVAIEEFYLSRRGPTVSELVREIERRCSERQLPTPSRKAVTSRVRQLDQAEALRRRKGATHARRKLGRIVGHLAEDQPLGLIQIDHTLADVIVVSSKDRRPLARPWLSLAIDVATRVVTGFHVSLEAPSALSVALVLSHAVLEKDDYLRGRGVLCTWPVHGIPRRLHLDNAKEFRSQALSRGTAQYGIDVQYRPVATPHWGGHIERLIGTMMGSLRMLPGSTGRNVAERDHDPEATACMTLDELETWLVHQIAGVYHQTVHRSLGIPPITAWSDAIERQARPPQSPLDPDRFILDFLPFKRRTIQRDGISLFNITYSDGVLATFMGKPRQQFIVRYDPRDLSQVYLRDEDGTYWPIPYSDRRLPPVTLGEVKAASSRLHSAGERHVTQPQIFASIDAQRAIVEGAEVAQKRFRRDQERSFQALRSRSGRQPAKPPGDDATPEEADSGPVVPFAVEEWST